MPANKNGTWKWLAGILALCAVSSAGWFVGHTGDEFRLVHNEIDSHMRSTGHPVVVERIKSMQGCIQGIQASLAEIRHDQRKILLEVQALKGRVR